MTQHKENQWIRVKTLLPAVGVVRLWQTASGLMAVGSLSDDERLVYMSDDDTRYLHVVDCVSHRSLPARFRDKADHLDTAGFEGANKMTQEREAAVEVRDKPIHITREEVDAVPDDGPNEGRQKQNEN